MIEVKLVQRMLDRRMAQEAMLIKLAIASTLDKDAGKEFRKVTERLNNGY